MKVLETKIEITEGGDELKLGMTVDVRILVAHRDKVLVMPKRLVPRGRPGGHRARVGAAGRADAAHQARGAG